MTERRIFLDASFWIALRDEREAGHEQARLRAREWVGQRCRLVVTAFVFAETHAYFSRSPRRRLQVLDDFERNPIVVCEPVLPGDQTEALRLLRQCGDKTYSFCDAVSFAIMRRLGVRHAASFDEHFRQFGEFEVLV